MYTVFTIFRTHIFFSKLPSRFLLVTGLDKISSLMLNIVIQDKLHILNYEEEEHI